MSGEKRVFLLAALALMVLCGVAGCKEEVIDENARLAWIEKEGGNPEIQEALHYVLTVTLKRLYRSSENEGTQDPSVMDAVMAARSADLQVLKKIRKSGFTQWDDPEIMIAACKTPFPAIVRTIQRWGGDVNAKGKGGWTALMWAAGTGNNLEVVKYLVSQGADINAETPWDNDTALLVAVRANNLEIVKYLVSEGANVNVKGHHYGSTALIFAVRADNLDIVKCLIDHGANINAKDKEYGQTALMWANNLEIVKYLVSQGTDINAKDREDHTVLDWAGFRGRKDMKEYLLSIGARSGHD